MDRQEIETLIALPLPELIALAATMRQKEAGNKVELCTIMNAKSGHCSEDCKFCAQSGRHITGVTTYPLKDTKEILLSARQAKDIGAERFDIVTSGNTLNADELQRIAGVISDIRATVGIKMCASLGKMSEEHLALLKEAGLSRYHHNIETSKNHFPFIVSTHSFEERLKTIKAAKKAGLEVCSGGILGLGESWDDRIEMALLLKELDITSVPLNILVPIKGTPFENSTSLSCIDAIKTIALFRIILKNKIIKIAAGRETILKDFQAMAFMAGANGMLIGGYLTIKGRTIEEDLKFVKEIETAWKA